MRGVRLSADAVHLILFPLEARTRLPALLSLLDESEQGRAQALAVDADRQRFIVAHAMTRAALGQVLGLPPASVRFTTGHYGKPAIAGGMIDVRFNLSHAGDFGLLALSLGRDVGVDIERERPVDALNIARRYFSPAEYSALAALPADDRIGAFFRCWTRKESFIKACGNGLSLPLARFTVSIERSEAALPITAVGLPAGRWTMVGVTAAAGYAAAVTAAGHEWRVIHADAPQTF